MDALLEFIKGKYQIIGFIIYIVYNEYKRWKSKTDEERSQRDELIKFKVKVEESEKYKMMDKARDEIDRYVLSQLKMYKTRIISHINEHEMIIIALDGILLSALIKVKRNLMEHIETNGYHELSNVELEEYILYISGEVYDTIINVLDKHKDVDVLRELIIKHEIRDMVRDIIDTSIGIHNRLLKKYEDI